MLSGWGGAGREGASVVFSQCRGQRVGEKDRLLVFWEREDSGSGSKFIGAADQSRGPVIQRLWKSVLEDFK